MEGLKRGKMSSGRGGSNNNAGVGSIPASSKKMVQSLKEIVDCPEVEIYAMLKECNMDPDEAVNRLLSQDPFHEVKSKREKKKESTSTRGGRGGVDRYSSRGITSQLGQSDFAASRGKPAYKKDIGLTAYASSAMGMANDNVNRRQPPVSDATLGRTFPTNVAENISAALPSGGFQSAWGGMPGQVSMADIVKMGRPHGKASSTISTSQLHIAASPGVPGPHDLPPLQNYAFEISETNPHSGIAGGQHVPPNDDWPIDDEPPVASISSVVDPSVDAELYGDHYDRIKEQLRSPLDEVGYVEDDVGDSIHSDFVQSGAESNLNVQEQNSGSASGFDKDLYQNINEHQVHHQEVGDDSMKVLSVTTNFQKLSLPPEDEDPSSEDDGLAVKIPDHLQVQSADCSHLSFGSFGTEKSSLFSGSFASRPVKSNDEEAPVATDASFVENPETRNSEYCEDGHLNTTSEGSDTCRMGIDTADFNASSVSQPDMSHQDMLKQEAPEVVQGNQYSFPSSTANYAFENSQQLNSSLMHSQASSQMQCLPSLSGVVPYCNSLPSPLLASNLLPLRESELVYSPFPISRSMPTTYSGSVSSINGQTVSMAEAMKSGNFSATQPTQALPGGSVSGGHAIPQQVLHPYMVSYPFLPQNHPYMASAFQQAFAAGNSNYPQSLAAALLLQYKNSVSDSSLLQSSAVGSGYGAAFGNSNSIPSNFPLNAPTAPAGTSMSNDDILSSQYKDASHLLSLQQAPGSRIISGVPGSTYYSIQAQGQSQQPPAGFRQSQQQPSQHYGPLSGYPNYYHHSQLQGGPTLEQQLHMSRDGALGGSQGQQPKQTAQQQIWQNNY